MEERLKILKLLEDGKINSEEAARLLEALSERPAWEHRPHFARKVVMPDMEKIFETVNSAIASSFGERVTQRELKFAGKKILSISNVSGAVNVNGTEQPEITVKTEGSGFQKVREEDSAVKLNYLSNDLDISVPKGTALKLRAVSGDIDINDYHGEGEVSAVSGEITLQNISGRLTIKTVSGDIEGTGLRAAIEVKTKSGDVELDFSQFDSATIETRTGDVELVIPKESSVTLKLVTESGDIDCALPLTAEERKPGYLTGTLGDGKGALKVIIEDEGDITIKTK